TLFPDMFSGPFDQSIIKRAVNKKLITISYINIRDFSTDKYKTVDGHPYGGGVGMLLRVDVVDRALKSIKKGHTILLDAGGTPYKQSKSKELSALDHLILICGHYEGVDERIRSLVDEEISIGDYVLTGGEIPAMVLTDSIVRLIPGVLGKPEATVHESFTGAQLEYPQYTEPQTYKGLKIPPVLLSGNHKLIDNWRKDEATKRTKTRRGDLTN
ncbi:MAG: tRNA (guanosine(37)-N1)-methyltransferase TrmD, partial [Candidatus Gottesmanbacteria bacterium]|nr:tRNA (guanosine(37)-N1)-methyltransferase TrmD [Candidatus Gottesmanbacteria bacterium]